MKPFRIVGGVAAALALALLPACQPDTGKSNADKPKVGFVADNPGTFWDIARAGAEQAAKDENVELVFRRPDKHDVDAQTIKIHEVMDSGAKIFALSVVDPKKQADFLKGLPSDVQWLCVDNDAPDTKYLCYIGTDNYQAGQAAGRLVREALPKGGKIAIFVGSVDSDNARNRRQGLIDELNGAKVDDVKDGTAYGKDTTKYTLFKTYEDKGNETQAQTNAEEALDALKDEADVCLIGLYAYNTPKILSAADKKSKLGKVKIVGFDEDDKTLQGIADGNVVGTVVQDPYQFGVVSVKVMAAVVKGDKSGLDKIQFIPFRVVTKEAGKDFTGLNHGEAKSVGVKEFQEQLKAKLPQKPAT